MVTGPSLTRATRMLAPNSPVATAWPSARSSVAMNCSYNGTAIPGLAARVRGLRVGEFPGVELLKSKAGRMSDLAGAASSIANWGMETAAGIDLLPVLQETSNKARLADGLVGLFFKACEGNQSWADASYARAWVS